MGVALLQAQRIEELGESQHDIESLIWQCSKKSMDLKSGLKVTSMD